MKYYFLLLLLTVNSVYGSNICPPINVKPKPSPTPEPIPSPTPEPTPSPTPEPTPSPTPSPNPGSAGNCIDIQAVIETTNMYRQWHQVGPLKWDSNLASDSAVYAEVLSKDCQLTHSRGNYGENLYSVTSYPSPKETCKPAVDAWYGEVVNYDFNAANLFSDNWPKGIGHFTQVVWKGTASFGCGEHLREGITLPYFPMKVGCKIVVCRSFPPGNVAADSFFRANVFPRIN